MSGREKGIIDVPFDPDAERVFPSYFLAFRIKNPQLGFRYHPFNFIFAPERSARAEVLLDFLHEVAHAQLSNGVLGLAMQSLHLLPASVEKILFTEITKIFQSWKPQSDAEKALYKELYLFGQLQALPHTSIASLIPTSELEALRLMLQSSEFRKVWRVFNRINRRRHAIHSRWRIVQEGFATFCSFEFAVENGAFGQSVLENAGRVLFPDLNDVSREVLFQQLRELAVLKKKRLLQIEKPHSAYAQGFHILNRIEKQHQSTFVALVAAFAASHFPYHTCELLDAPEPQFQAWLNQTVMNPYERLVYLENNPDLLKPFAVPDLSDAALPQIMSELLHCFPGYTAANGVSFGSWSTKHLWGSPFYAEAFRIPPIACAGKAIETLASIFTEDRSESFVHGEIFIPTVLCDDGTVLQSDENVRRAFVGDFVNCYEVERTEKLLETLANVFDIAPPDDK